MISSLQSYLYFGLILAAFAVQLWALVSAVRFNASLYIAAGKRTKAFWVAFLIPAAVVGFCSIPPPLGIGYDLMFLNIIGFVLAAVYLTDVRPRLQEIRGSGRRGHGNTGGW